MCDHNQAEMATLVPTRAPTSSTASLTKPLRSLSLTCSHLGCCMNISAGRVGRKRGVCAWAACAGRKCSVQARPVHTHHQLRTHARGHHAHRRARVRALAPAQCALLPAGCRCAGQPRGAAAPSMPRARSPAMPPTAGTEQRRLRSVRRRGDKQQSAAQLHRTQPSACCMCDGGYAGST